MVHIIFLLYSVALHTTVEIVYKAIQPSARLNEAIKIACFVSPTVLCMLKGREQHSCPSERLPKQKIPLLAFSLISDI